jgi:hypothetical protein
MLSTVISIAYLVLFGSCIALVIVAQHSEKARANAAKEGEQIEQKALLANVAGWLQPALFALVTQAERDFGGGAGRLKLAAVIAQALALLPDKVKGLVDADWLAAQVETALAKAREAWAESGNFLKNEAEDCDEIAPEPSERVVFDL